MLERKGKKAVFLLAAGLGVFLCAGGAGASMVDLYGWGSRATAMGGAFTVLADDFSAVYYNPAGLIAPRTLDWTFQNRKGIQFDFGYVYCEPRFHIRDADGSRQTVDYGSTTGPYLGITFDPTDFHGTFRRKVFAFGIGLYFPVDHLLYYGRYWPEERAYPFFYDYTMRFVLIPGIAVEVLPNLSLGVSLRILGRLNTETTGTVDVNFQQLLSPDSLIQHRIRLERSQVHLGEFEDLTLHLAPIASLLYRPLKRWRFGAVYRGENWINDFGVTDPVINLGGLLSFPQGYSFEFVRFFTPHQVFLGVACHPVEPVTLSLDLGWFDWSKFLNVEADKPEPPFRDTWMPRFGMEYRWKKWLSFRGGYFYYQTPVPEQKGLWNYLDNDRHVFSVGSELVVEDPPGFWDKPLFFSFHFQYHYVVNRQYTKTDARDPYFPGYSFGGTIFSLGVQISMPL